MSQKPNPPHIVNSLLLLHNQQLETDIKEAKRLQTLLEKRLAFETLLSEISSEFTNLPASEVDRKIIDGLKRVGKFLGVDRCNLSQLSVERRVARMVHSWAEDHVQPLPENLTNSRKFFPWLIDRMLDGKVVQYSTPEELPEEAATDKENLKKFGAKSEIIVPVMAGGKTVGALSISTIKAHRTWPMEMVRSLQRLGEVFANSLDRKEKDLKIHNALSKIKKLKNQLEADCIYLREEIDMEHSPNHMIGQSELFKQLRYKINQIAKTDVTVLILGETGTGKELVARSIHAASSRKDRPIVKVNCAALPANLIESELFGHEKGAFTDAQERKAGRFELADGNTLFLDEIGELPLESQAKLLRVLQDGEFERLGSSQTLKVDVRIIAATNRNLEQESKEGRFRQDLWYRLNVFPIGVPPLRSRRDDIPLLTNWFVEKFNKKLGKTIKRIPLKLIKTLQNYHWPGNIRELENVIERASINTQHNKLTLMDHLETSQNANHESAPIQTLETVERVHITRALEKCNWRIYGPKGAALKLGLHHSTLRYRMRKLGIQKPF